MHTGALTAPDADNSPLVEHARLSLGCVNPEDCEGHAPASVTAAVCNGDGGALLEVTS